MGSITAETRTWHAAGNILRERADNFRMQLSRVRESFDPEAIHDLRVSSRRLREAITIFSKLFKKRRRSSLLEELKALVKSMGSIRNCDEAIRFFSTLTEKCAAGVKPVVSRLIATLSANREQEKLCLHATLEKIDPDSFVAQVEKLCKTPRNAKSLKVTLRQPVSLTVLAALAKREKTILELLPEALMEENATPLHRLRISVKRLRYRLELLAPFAKGDYKGVYSTIKSYQEILGHIHDLDVFATLADTDREETAAGKSLQKLILKQRKKLFAEFIRLNEASPLAEIGDRIKELI
ncbi:MAG: CHAD domain-containing protein [Geobacteraceae bacterium]|nr:CHAD domain-containing protein [Geobacteraceae bacterium]